MLIIKKTFKRRDKNLAILKNMVKSCPKTKILNYEQIDYMCIIFLN